MRNTCTKPENLPPGSRVAVVGAGISGLASAWLLQRRYRVTLIEAEPRLGGHTNTRIVREAGRDLPVDTGFIVYNERNYPLLTRLFAWLGVATQPGDMSFGVSIRDGRNALEYAGDNLATLFARPASLLDPMHWKMLADILRFNRETRAALRERGLAGQTLGEYLDRGRFSAAFRERYLLPMGGAIWSCPVETMSRFPAESFARFFENHGLLSLNDRPRWRTVTGGSQAYVHRLVQEFEGRIETRATVARVRELDTGVELLDAKGHARRFDAVVLATHADQSLAMLETPRDTRREILSAFDYQPNVAWLHSDPEFMPTRRRAWSSWNYLAAANDHSRNIAVTYWMNRLQSLDARQNYFVTLNPWREPDKAHARIDYAHPVFTSKAIAAQQHLDELQGARLLFAGAWQGYGFHEDGLRSAINVAARLGVTPPWQLGAPVQSMSEPVTVPAAARVAAGLAG